MAGTEYQNWWTLHIIHKAAFPRFDKYLSLVDTCQVVGKLRLSVSHMTVFICDTGRTDRQYQFTIWYEKIS